MSSDLTLLQVGGAPAAGLTDALTSAAGYALSEKADATRRAYRADIRRFTTWCEAVGAIALPATPATVAAYLAALADLRLKVSTISRRAAAIAYAHKLAGFEPHEPPAPAHDELREAVAVLDPDTMSPREAHAALYELKRIAEKKA